MTDMITNPSTPTDYKNAALQFEATGEDAMRQTGAARDQIVSQLHDYLKNLTPDQRAQFYDAFAAASIEAQTPKMTGTGTYSMSQGFSQPSGTVEKDSSGKPVGIEFEDSALGRLWNSIMRNPPNEIHVKP